MLHASDVMRDVGGIHGLCRNVTEAIDIFLRNISKHIDVIHQIKAESNAGFTPNNRDYTLRPRGFLGVRFGK